MAHTKTGIDAIEKTLQKTNQWIRELDAELGWNDPHFAFQALRAVLHHLRDRLPLATVAHLGDQLPILIRGVYYENWSPTREVPRVRTTGEFLGQLVVDFPKEYNLNALRMARAVITVLRSHVSEGEIRIVLANLPPDFSVLFE
ncbi:MAG: DUF2267 domain-containing protein [Fibrobacteria bacterium]